VRDGGHVPPSRSSRHRSAAQRPGQAHEPPHPVRPRRRHRAPGRHRRLDRSAGPLDAAALDRRPVLDASQRRGLPPPLAPPPGPAPARRPADHHHRREKESRPPCTATSSQIAQGKRPCACSSSPPAPVSSSRPAKPTPGAAWSPPSSTTLSTRPQIRDPARASPSPGRRRRPPHPARGAQPPGRRPRRAGHNQCPLGRALHPLAGPGRLRLAPPEP
jgi:hypothetical protein